MIFRDGYRWALDGPTLAAAAGAYLSRRAQSGLADRSADIVALAHDSGTTGIRRDDVAAGVGMSPDTASIYLQRLYGSGRLKRAERGLYTCVCSVCSPPVPDPTKEQNIHNPTVGVPGGAYPPLDDGHTTPRTGEALRRYLAGES
jgi:hypothetical protein